MLKYWCKLLLKHCRTTTTHNCNTSKELEHFHPAKYITEKDQEKNYCNSPSSNNINSYLRRNEDKTIHTTASSIFNRTFFYNFKTKLNQYIQKLKAIRRKTSIMEEIHRKLPEQEIKEEVIFLSDCSQNPPQVVLVIPQGVLDQSEHSVSGEILCDSFQDLFSSYSPKSTTINGVRKFHASHLICKRKGLLILRCITQIPKRTKRDDEQNSDVMTLQFCLKLRYPFSEIEEEVQRFKSMMLPEETNDSCKSIYDLFPEFYGFVKFQMPHDETWGGICMEFYDLSAADILYSKYHHSHKKTIQTLEKNYTKKCSQSMSFLETKRGIPIAYIHGRSVYTSLAASCIQLLRTLHKFNWIHGDTHLANFLIDTEEMRVVLIDMERSFKTTNSVQKLLDIQEVFGHISTLIVSMPYNSSWDMRDVQGVAGLLHPFNSLCLSKKKTKHTSIIANVSQKNKIEQILVSYQMSNPLAKIHAQIPERFRHLTPKTFMLFLMLPLCNCYARHHMQERIKGCIYCRSEFSKRTAHMLYMDNTLFDEVMDNFIKASLSTIQFYIQCTRHYIRLNASEARDHLTTHDDTFQEILHKQIKKREISFTDFQCEKDIDIYDLYIQRLIYLGAFIPNYTKLNERLIHHLRSKKLDGVASRIQKITLPTYKHNGIYESFMMLTEQPAPMPSPEEALEPASLTLQSDASDEEDQCYDIINTSDDAPPFAASYTCLN